MLSIGTGLRSRYQIDMIGHQAIRQDLDLEGVAPLCNELEIALVILDTKKCLAPASWCARGAAGGPILACATSSSLSRRAHRLAGARKKCLLSAVSKLSDVIGKV